MDKIVVKIADYKIASGHAVLTTYGLGSCLAVALYDPETKTGGMGHIMLPNGTGAKASGNPKKFADLCITEMFRELEISGCKTSNVVAKIAGGASMFDIPYTENFCIGDRNRASVVAELVKMGIPLIGEDTGGKHGRSVDFHIDDGRMIVKSLRSGIKVI